MKYTILKIFEEDYGCEGIPEGEELMCSVLVRDTNGNEKWLRVPDSRLTGLNTGDNLEVKDERDI